MRFTNAITGWNPAVHMNQFKGYSSYLISRGYSESVAESLVDAGFGGCVFDLQFFTQAITVDESLKPLLAFLDEFKEKTFVTDYMFATLVYSSPPNCIAHGQPNPSCGTTGAFPELAEFWMNDFTNRVASGRTAVVHKYKEEYRDAPNDEDKKTLGWLI